jgi:hypothetical protein
VKLSLQEILKTTKIYNLENIKRFRHLDDRTSAH